jgi:hypothetical protein
MIPRDRPESCLSDFALDRRLAGEFAPAEEASALEHVATCRRCERRWAELRAGRDAFAAEAPPLSLGAVPARGGGRAWRVVAGGCVAAAAVVALVLRGHPDDAGTRAKGGSSARFGFFVRHAGTVREGRSGERVQPGDALRFVYRGRDPRYIAVLSVDGAGRASTYFPDSPVAPREEPGVALPASTVLDDTLGEERLYGVSCPDPFDVEMLRKALEAAPRQSPAPKGCDVDAIVVRKEAALGR